MNKLPAGIINLVCLFFLLAGCSGEREMNAEDYLKWISDPENGLVQQKKVNGIAVSVKFLPAEYLAYKEMKEIKSAEKDVKHIKDSLLKKHENSRTFLFTIGPDEEKGNKDDIMFTGLRNYEEYIDRAMTMNFDLENYVILKTDQGELRPVLSAMENVYGLSKTRNILFLFTPSTTKEDFKKVKTWDFVYADELFDLGTLHFNFKKEDIDKLPAIKY